MLNEHGLAAFQGLMALSDLASRAEAGLPIAEKLRDDYKLKGDSKMVELLDAFIPFLQAGKDTMDTLLDLREKAIDEMNANGGGVSGLF